MKLLKFYLGNMMLSIRRKPLYFVCIALMIGASVLLSAFVYKIGGIMDSSKEVDESGKTVYSYNFDVGADIDLLAVKAFGDKNGSQIEIINNDLPAKIIFADAQIPISAGVSAEDFFIGKNVVILDYEIAKSNNLSINDTYKIGDVEYRILGISESVHYAIVPYKADTSAIIATSSGCSMSSYNKISSRLIKQLENDSKLKYIDESIAMLIPILFMIITLLVCSINLFLLMGKYLRRNKRLYKVYKSVGMSNGKMVVSMFIETLLIFIVGFGIGIGLCYAILPRLMLVGAAMTISVADVFIWLGINAIIICAVFLLSCINNLQGKLRGRRHHEKLS